MLSIQIVLILSNKVMINAKEQKYSVCLFKLDISDLLSLMSLMRLSCIIFISILAEIEKSRIYNWMELKMIKLLNIARYVHCINFNNWTINRSQDITEDV